MAAAGLNVVLALLGSTALGSGAICHGCAGQIPIRSWMAHSDVAQKIGNVRGTVSVYIHPSLGVGRFTIGVALYSGPLRGEFGDKNLSKSTGTSFTCEDGIEIAQAVMPQLEATTHTTLSCMITVAVRCDVAPATTRPEIAARADVR